MRTPGLQPGFDRPEECHAGAWRSQVPRWSVAVQLRPASRTGMDYAVTSSFSIAAVYAALIVWQWKCRKRKG